MIERRQSNKPAIKRKKMKFQAVKAKIPQPNFDELTRQVNERNEGKRQEDFIDEAYLASEILQLHTQPKIIT